MKKGQMLVASETAEHRVPRWSGLFARRTLGRWTV